MNKQEVIDELTKTQEKFYEVWMNLDLDKSSRDTAINVYTGIMIAKTYVDQLDEPQDEKVEVPDFVAKWYEANKSSLESNIAAAFRRIGSDEHYTKGLVYEWLNDSSNEPIQTLFKMKNGYTIKPKRWVVKHKDDCIYFEKFDEDKYDFSAIWTYLAEPPAFKFTDKSKAEAVATLVDGSVEEI